MAPESAPLPRPVALHATLSMPGLKVTISKQSPKHTPVQTPVCEPLCVGSKREC